MSASPGLLSGDGLELESGWKVESPEFVPADQTDAMRASSSANAAHIASAGENHAHGYRTSARASDCHRHPIVVRAAYLISFDGRLLADRLIIDKAGRVQ